MTEGRQRLDKWLFFSRLLKSRTLAAALVDDGFVRLNGVRVTDPAKPVKAGDVLTVALHHTMRVVRVTTIGHRRGPPVEAQALYDDLSGGAQAAPMASCCAAGALSDRPKGASTAPQE